MVSHEVAIDVMRFDGYGTFRASVTQVRPAYVIFKILQLNEGLPGFSESGNWKTKQVEERVLCREGVERYRVFALVLGAHLAEEYDAVFRIAGNLTRNSQSIRSGINVDAKVFFGKPLRAFRRLHFFAGRLTESRDNR